MYKVAAYNTAVDEPIVIVCLPQTIEKSSTHYKLQ